MTFDSLLSSVRRSSKKNFSTTIYVREENTHARAPVVVFFLLCRRRFARGETHNHYGSLLSVCNAMMDDHIALCVRRVRENTLFFLG